MEPCAAATVSYIVPLYMGHALGQIARVTLRSVQPWLTRRPPIGTIGGAGDAEPRYAYMLQLAGLERPAPLLADSRYASWGLIDQLGQINEGTTAILDGGQLRIVLSQRIHVTGLHISSGLGVHVWPVTDAAFASG